MRHRNKGIGTRLQLTARCSWVLLLASCAAAAEPGPTQIPVLALPDLGGWQDKVFSGKTDYRVVDTEAGLALQARSDAAASGLIREINVDLTKTPFLHWSWRINNTFKATNETTREGDDYPARLYVVISGGWQFWRTRALNYVWASQHTQYSHWPNAYTDHAIMLAVRSGDALTNQWVEEKRNVLDDIRQYLKMDARHIHAVAIMTDTDNTGRSATAYYGNIYFSEQ